MTWSETPLLRREFLRKMLYLAAGAGGLALFMSGRRSRRNELSTIAHQFTTSRFARIGPLLPPNADGVELPEGFGSRVVAVSGEPPIAAKSDYVWHLDPDGGATFRTDDGGWIYVSNSEVRDSTRLGMSREKAQQIAPFRGGVGALRFDASGEVTDAYSCQSGTTTNCSGGATPWGTWLNGEEIGDGYMFECSPLRGGGRAVRLDRFGRKGHEMVAVDPDGLAIYHTEDFGRNERFYRTVFDSTSWRTGSRPDMAKGRLQVLQVPEGLAAALAGPTPIRWLDAVDDGRPQMQVADDVPSTLFTASEGVWYLDGWVFVSTKRNNTLWAIDVAGQTIECIYRPDNGIAGSLVDGDEPPLYGLDNLVATLDGELLVAEDGGDLRCMVLLPDRTTIPLLRLPGNRNATEVTGLAIAPTGDRLYLSSQRAARLGKTTGYGKGGITYEITMPFKVRVNRPLAQPL